MVKRKIKLMDLYNNPCGKPCMPFNPEYCFLENYSANHIAATATESLKTLDHKPEKIIALSRALCGLLIENLNKEHDLIETKDSANFWKSITESLTTDDLTGLLTGKGLGAVLDELYKPEVINKLLEEGHTARIVYADVNDLKKHNSGPGGHEQGDLAIATVGGAIYNYLKSGRRKNLTEHREEDRRNSIQIPRVIAARSNEKGDEFFIMSIHKNNSDARSRGLRLSKVLLDNLLSCMCYEYGGIEYEVSATFGITEVKLPENRKELKKIINAVDVAMMEHKIEAKQHGKTMGRIVNIS